MNMIKLSDTLSINFFKSILGKNMLTLINSIIALIMQISYDFKSLNFKHPSKNVPIDTIEIHM